MIKERASGFTLIELMVVISIIAMLSSVVLTGLSDARLKAVNTKFSQEVIALRQALLLYRSNHTDFLPHCDESGCTWNDVLDALPLETQLSSLTSEGLISGIPQYRNTDPGPAPFALINYNLTYRNGASEYEYSCRDIEYSDWTFGQSSGILEIVSNQILQLPLDYTGCIDNAVQSDCTRTVSGLYNSKINSVTYYYCLSLDFE